MKYLSVCSGIEAATCAWHGLGWTPFAFSEIEPFPSAVLAHHYPNTPNLGDMTKFKEWPDADVNVLVGGTPCQSFSVAGLRKGLADPRGNLMLTYLAIADRYRPRWVVWENVPGVLSSNGGRDFGTFLGALGELGYGWAYRTLDAQYFGVAQRRRRVFVVGHLGDWRRAAAVLFERESLLGNPSPRREKREGTPPTTEARTFECGGIGSYSSSSSSSPLLKSGADLGHGCEALISKHWPAEVGSTLNAHYGDKWGLEDQHALGGAALFVPDTAHSLRAEGFDASEDGTGRGTPLVPVTYIGGIDYENNAHGMDEATGPLLKGSPTGGGRPLPAVAFAQNTRDEVREMPYVGALAAEPGMKQTSYIRQSMQVRRLTPRECERLQGFPDDYTLIPVRGKPAADGPRYKALGNSMAVPVMRWIGGRIQMVETI